MNAFRLQMDFEFCDDTIYYKIMKFHDIICMGFISSMHKYTANTHSESGSRTLNERVNNRVDKHATTDGL